MFCFFSKKALQGRAVSADPYPWIHKFVDQIHRNPLCAFGVVSRRSSELTPPLEAWGRFSPLTTNSLNHGGSGTEPSWIRGHTYTQKLLLKMSKILLLYKASLGEFVLRCKAATLIKPVYFIVVFVFLHSILLALWVEGVVMSFFSMSYKFI